MLVGACSHEDPGTIGDAEAQAKLSELRARPASPLGVGLATRFDSVPGGREPRFAASAGSPAARVLLPERASASVYLEDLASGMSVEVLPVGTRAEAARPADGYLVYPGAHESGATILQRALPIGTEDFVSFETRPAAAAVTYKVGLLNGVAGLRLVAGTLEMLDAKGTPRLRVAPPFITGANGARTDATLALEGCAFDANPAAPWGRGVTAPGATKCSLRVTWDDRAVAYPAVLDPSWTTTGSMATARQGHTATLLSTGKVLVAGGSNGTTVLSSAELYDRTTGTWAATASMTGARQLHTATQLGTSSNSTTSGAVLIAGGLNGTTSQSTAQLYSPTAGTWTAAANLNAARHGHTATRLADGRVLVAGGLNGTATLATAALYDPASGTGSWAATTGPIPPPGQQAHTATLLATSNAQLNNKVLLVGGNSGTATMSAVYLFDPVQSAFSTLASMPSPREGHTATVLANGNILFTGGKNGTTTLATAVIFNPSSGPGSWTTAGTMTSPRQGHTATLLPAGLAANGQVLVAGGSNGATTLASAELFSGTSTWTATTAMPGPVQGQTATALGNGAILIAGGVNGTTTLSAARLYDASSGLGCTSNSQCATGFCASGVCCNTACTDQCSACNLTGSVGTCAPKSNGTTCNDGNACTQTDTCQSGMCTGANPKVCTPSDQCHVAGTCAPSTGVCSNPNANNGTSCSDGNACTQTDTCQAGVCTGGNPKVCTPSDQCHVAGSCAPATGVCSNPNANNGTTCNDGNACTQTDSCQSGVCTGTNPVTCPTPAQCHAPGSCDPTSGICSTPNVPDGTNCIDGRICTQTDTCQAGTCVGGNPVVCQPLDACHVAGTCLEPIGCTNPPAPDGTGCDDGNACTVADRCTAGVCGGGAVTCSASDQCHGAGSCDPTTGACSNPALADGTTCNDGDACTQSDSCTAGVCNGGTKKACPPSDQCHTRGICNPADGTCSNPAVVDGTACNDGNNCTEGDLCRGGTCISGPPVTCTALDACHVPGACDPNSGQCSNPVFNDPSCIGAPPPTVTPLPQNAPGLVPLEIAGLDPTTGTLSVGPSAGAFGTNAVPPQKQTIAALVGGSIECMADMDGDGETDVVFVNATNGTLQYLSRLSMQLAAYSSTPVTIDGAIPGSPVTAACGDVDGDGKTDMVMSFGVTDGSGGKSPAIFYYRSLGGSFERIGLSHGFISGNVASGLGLADFDGDGKLDLAVYAANSGQLDSQLFVFPNSGVAQLPYSLSTRVSVPGTNVLANATRTVWGGLTIRDWDGDGHPDIWALGNLGGLYLFRSIGGFQFASPEFNGVISNLSPTFAMDSVDGTGDGLPDLIITGLEAGATSQVYASAGGGMLVNYIAPVGIGCAIGRPCTPNHPTVWNPVTVTTAPGGPGPDLGIGLLKQSPVPATYFDSNGVSRPSILAEAVNGHLVERIQTSQTTTTVETLAQLLNITLNDGSTTILSTIRINVTAPVYTWVDHGVPAVTAASGGTAHQTIVGSEPAVVWEFFTSTPVRRIYVRGLDGHLWELDQQGGTEQWVDDGLPTPNQTTGPDPTGGAIVPLVGAPSAVSDFDSGEPRTFVYVLDAAGRLDSFHIPNDDTAWRTMGPIGSNNCFGTPGTLGEGSPKAINWPEIDVGTVQGKPALFIINHTEVFVVGAMGDLYSWLDGNWEENLDAQYTIAPRDLIGTNSGVTQAQLQKDTASPVCPNSDTFNPGLPEQLTWRPQYSRSLPSRGTPDATAWTTTLCLFNGQDCFSSTSRLVVTRSDSGGLNQFLIAGNLSKIASTSPFTNLPTVDASQIQLFNGSVENPNISLPVTLGLNNQIGFVLPLQPPFCATAGGAPVQDTIISDPALVMTADGAMTVLATSVEHHLTMYHRSSVTTLFYPSPTQAQWEKRPFTGYPANLNNYADAIIGNAVAFPGTASIQTNSGPATVPTLDLFAIRSNGTLIEGASNPDASGNWRNCDLNPSCPAAAGCTSGGGFSWLFDPAHDHSVSGAPAILDDQVGFSVNGPSVSNCSDHDLLNTIAPQWVSPQRQNSAYKDQEFHGTPLIQGYNDDVPTEVEGVVVDSHIAAIDTPINHTHGKSTDWPLVHHDWNVIVAPDVKYQNMLTDANMLEGGVMEMEWEAADHIGCDQFDDDGDCTHQALFSPVDNPPTVSEDQRAAFTADAFPSIGDRVAIRGRFIFDCGHPPYRAELHPIDAIAVIHNSEYAKVRYSENGGSQWYQPADVNLASSSDAKCSLNQKLQDLGAGLIPQPNVSGFGPLDDTLDTIEKVVEAIGVYEFGTGCFRHYDPTLISPQTLGKDGYSNTCYNTYEGPMINLFSESTTPKTADPPFFPLSFSPATAFTFTVPGGPQITPVFNNHSGATTRVYTNGTVGQSLDICFQRQALKSHDTVDHGIQLCIPDVNCCDDDTTEELVTWITVNGLSRLYVEGGDNCLPVAVYPDDTLTIGSHGFECDLSCAEHWDDPEAANATDDRIGSIKIAFTADQNWGLPGTDLGGHTYSGTYTVKTQPDLGTHRSRDLSAGDYQMTISVVPTVVIADQQGGSP